MERLQHRLDYTQEKILTLYEKDSTDINDHISLWMAVRHENVLFHTMRKRGIVRVMGRSIPSLQASEKSAKDAIMMQLQLEDLAKSPYGLEPWSLSETTLERYLAPPRETFKKGGVHVNVTFDNEESNSAEYVMWTYIYVTDENGDWHKTQGGVDRTGIYYIGVDGSHIYYVYFEDEAAQHSRTGQYTVNSDQDVSDPVINTDSSRNRETGEETPRRRGTYLRRSSPAAPARPTPPQRSRQRKRSPAGPTTNTTPETRPTLLSARNRRSRSGRSPSATGGRHQARHRSSAERPGPTPQFYLIGCRGPVNTLRCYRFKLKKRPNPDITYISTTFNWTAPQGTDRCGSGRFLIAFTSKEHRDEFYVAARPPPNIGLFKGECETI
nr:E2 [Erethizon dorsatum papillomavirus 1]WCD67583.1 E2 protein [Erethizon dorsatum papillomavirus 1]